MKTVLIIGINGFVGTHLCNELIKNGYKCYGADINSDNFSIDGIGFEKLDILNADIVKDVIDRIKPDYVVNLAAISSVKQSWNIPGITFDINVKGVINIFEAIKEVGINPRVLLIGSSEEYGLIKTENAVNENYPLNALNPYAISKMTQEKIAMMYKEVYGIDVIMVRAFNHIGPNQKLGFVIPDFANQIAKIENGEIDPIMYVGNLKAERDMTDVRDIVNGYSALLEKGVSGEVYNIGSGRTYSIEYMLKQLIKNSKVEIKIEIDKSKFRPIDTPKILCDNSKIKSHTGWEPQIDIHKSLEDILNYYRINLWGEI